MFDFLGIRDVARRLHPSPPAREGNALTLADYRVAREVDGRGFRPDEIKLLQKADDALGQTRDAFPNGRGNVLANVARSNGAAYRLTVAGRDIERKLEAGEIFIPGVSVPPQIATAVSGEAVGAGNCGEMTQAAVHRLADRFAPGERIASKDLQSSNDPRKNHAWVEFSKGAFTAVVDPHSEAPPLDLSDTVFARARGTEQYAYETADQARAYGSLKHVVQERVYEHADDVAAIERSADGLAVPRNLEPAMPILASNFHARVGNKLAHAQNDPLERRRFLDAARTVAEQDGCASEVACERAASELYRHLAASWNPAV